MSRTPFFLSDPLPEDMQDPDDPLPEDMQDPDDPLPEDMQDPDDPLPEDMQDPDDPLPEDMQDPDDPLPEDMQDPDDPLPEDMQDPDDPTVRQAAGLARRRAARRYGGRRRRPATRRRRKRPKLEYSGRIVVRLSENLDLPSLDESRLGQPKASDLRAVSRRLNLPGLRRVLKEYRVAAKNTGRMVNVEFEEVELEYAVGADKRQDEQRAPSAPEPHNRLTTWELEREAASSGLRPLHSLAAYWHVDARNLPRKTEPAPGEMRVNGWTPSHERTTRAILRELNELPEVDLAYRELAVSDPNGGSNDLYAGFQEYLDRAPVGIGARWVFRQQLPVGARARFLDLEQGWTRHEDLGEAFNPELRIVVGSNRDGIGDYRGDHGTAVLGELIGVGDNRLGVRGIAAEPRVVLLASHYDADEDVRGNVGNAIRQAIGWMDKGDVLLLEVQRSYRPTEVDPLDRDAIRLAVSRGIVVIEAAGNGNADLDRYVDEEGKRFLKRRHPDYRESGALMVAAARTAPPHNRLRGREGVGSNYGTRIDCFAHGDRVVTTGYGDLSDYLDAGPTAPGSAYSARFGGTSGAAPIIAGAALVVQDLHNTLAGSRLSPWEMRRLLSDPSTGTRQGRGVRGRIGVMPDLKRILRDRLGLAPGLYLRDHPLDEGHVPVRMRTSCSPDIIVSESATEPARFDDSYPGAGELRSGEQYSIFVRLRNRGLAAATEPKVRLYSSPVATLVTPEMWQEVEGTASVKLSVASPGDPEEVRDQPVWTEPIGWSPGPPDPSLATTDGEARWCFTAIVRDSRDDEVIEPPSAWPYFSWRRYLAFLHRHSSVACRNVHMVESGTESVLPFLLTGTPDRPRAFDLEILRDLPADTQIRLWTHPAVAAALRRYRLWPAEEEVVGEVAWGKLSLPRQPRLRIAGVRLTTGARIPCRLEIKGRAERGHSVAIRQLYRRREVGRITWRFRDAD